MCESRVYEFFVSQDHIKFRLEMMKKLLGIVVLGFGLIFSVNYNSNSYSELTKSKNAQYDFRINDYKKNNLCRILNGCCDKTINC